MIMIFPIIKIKRSLMLLWIKLLNVTEKSLHLTTQQLVSCITSATFNNSSQGILQVVYSVINV